MSDEPRFVCTVCNEAFKFKWEHHEHIHSYSHHKKISTQGKGRTMVHGCMCCRTTIHSIVEYADHINTKKHKNLLETKIQSMKYNEEKGQKLAEQQQKLAEQQQRYHNRQHRAPQRHQRPARDQQPSWNGTNNGYQSWEQGQGNPGEYIQLNPRNGRGKRSFQNAANNWNRPFGFQYPHNQPAPYYNNYAGPSYTEFSSQPLPRAPPRPASRSHSTSHIPSLLGMDMSVQPAKSLSNTTATATLAMSTSNKTHSSNSSRPPSTEIGSSKEKSSPMTYDTPSADAGSTGRQDSALNTGEADKAVPGARNISNNGKALKITTTNKSPIADKLHEESASVQSSTNSTKKLSRSSSRANTPTDQILQSSAASASKKLSSKPSPSQGLSSSSRRSSESSTESHNTKKKTTRGKEMLKNIKKEPPTDVLSETPRAKVIVKKKPTDKRGNLHGLLQGRATSRHLQYQLDKAVKMRRSGQGRNYNIQGEDGIGLPDGCELESLADGDAGRVEALLENMESLQPARSQVAAASSSTYPSGSAVTEGDFPATMDNTRRVIDPACYSRTISTDVNKYTTVSEPAVSTPSVTSSKKRKDSSPVSTQTSTTSKKVKRKNVVQPKIKGKKITKSKVSKASKLKQAAISKSTKKVKKSTSSRSTTDGTTAVMRDESPLPSPTIALKTEVEEKEGVISQILSLTMREEKIREELPVLEYSIRSMKERQQQLIEEQKVLEKKLEQTCEQSQKLRDEEASLRKARIAILTMAEENKSKPSTVVQQADIISSTTDVGSNTQYLGGFVTSDADEEQKVFSDLKERVRHLSQGSDTESSSKISRSSSSKGLTKIEQRMHEIVRSQKRKSLQGENEVLFEGHLRPIQHLVVKGDFLYSSSGDRTLRRFDIKTGACVSTYHGHENTVKCFVVLSRQKEKVYIYSADMDGYLLVFDADTSTLLKRHTIGQSINCIIETWGCLYLGLHDGDIVSYSIEDSHVMERYKTAPSGIMSMCTAQEGARRLIICGSYDRLVSVRDVKSGLLLRILPESNQFPRCLMVDENRPYLYVGADDILRVYNYEKGVVIKEFRTGSDIRSMCTHKDSTSYLLTASQDGKISQFNIETIQLNNIYQMPGPILAITCKKGYGYVGDNNGHSRSFQITGYSIRCKVGDCNLPYANNDQLITHIFTTHLTELVSKNTCPWTNCTSHVHHKSIADLREHLYECHMNT